MESIESSFIDHPKIDVLDVGNKSDESILAIFYRIMKRRVFGYVLEKYFMP
jgi:hypothetical protein